jgi:CheY-like chemotaxis protein
MQGRIWIESELGKGSKFIFTIKVKKGMGTVSADVEEASFNFKGHTILVADDVEINREIVSALLEKTGISVDFAENGKEAVSMFGKAPDKYSLILMDVHMPEMDGYEATQAIRGLDSSVAKNICIIALTANVFKEDIEKLLSAGMNGHIAKPIDPNDLYLMLKKHLEMRKH